jgi:uncharacterized LabA/DUF88 family protein
MVFEGVKDGLDKIRKKVADRPKIAFFIDGPNMIRKEFNLNLKDLRKRVETVIALGDPEQKTDVDVSVAVHAMDSIYNPEIDMIALSSRDADFLPLIQKAKEKGKVTILVVVDSGLAISLRHAADHVELLK